MQFEPDRTEMNTIAVPKNFGSILSAETRAHGHGLHQHRSLSDASTSREVGDFIPDLSCLEDGCAQEC